MKNLLAVIAVALTACINGTITFPEYHPKCTNQQPPALAGRWQGALQERSLMLTLTEQCEVVPYSYIPIPQDSWVVRGQWDWGGLVQGTTRFEPYFYGDELHVFLGADSLARDGVMLTLRLYENARYVLPAPPALGGTATGAWPRIGAAGEVWGPFDAAPVTLDRR